MTLKDLNRVCNITHTPRASISKPFSFGRHTYATDGRIIVRVPKIKGARGDDGAPKKSSQKLFKEQFPGAGVKWTDLPKMEPVYCPQCAGRGECLCGDCGVPHGCGRCNGAKKTILDQKLGSNTYAGRYLAFLASIPAVKVIPDYNAGEFTKAMPFKFRGGIGLLMPSQH